MKSSEKFLTKFLQVLLVFLILTVPVIFIGNWRWGYNSDVAMIGLMAKEWMDTGLLNIFVWTVGYQGMLLDVPVTAFFFKLFGIHPITLSLTPFFFTLMMIFVGYHLLLRCFNRFVALVFCIYVLTSGPDFYTHFLRTIPNYPETCFGGFLTALVLFQILHKNPASPTSSLQTKLSWLHTFEFKIFLLGVLLGFFNYIFSLYLFFTAAILLQIIFATNIHLSKDFEKNSGHIYPWILLPTSLEKNIMRSFFSVAAILSIVGSFLFLNKIPMPLAGIPLRIEYVYICFGGLLIPFVYPILREYKKLKLVRVLGINLVGMIVGYSPALYFRFVQNRKSHRGPSISGSYDDFMFRYDIIWHYFRNIFFEDIDGDYKASKFIFYTILLAFGVFMAYAIYCYVGKKDFSHSKTKKSNHVPDKNLMMIFFASAPMATIFAFLGNPKVDSLPHIRWLMPMIPLACVCLAWLTVKLFQHPGKLKFVTRALAVFIFAVFIQTGIGRFTKANVNPKHDNFDFELINEQMVKHNLKTGYADYWLAYACNLLSFEKTVLQPLYSAYNPAYVHIVNKEDRQGIFMHVGQLTKNIGDEVEYDDRIYKITYRELLKGKTHSYDFAIAEFSRVK